MKWYLIISYYLDFSEITSLLKKALVVGIDQTFSNCTVVMWTRVSFIKPSQDTGVTKSMATRSLVGVSKTTKTYWAFVLLPLMFIHKIICVAT